MTDKNKTTRAWEDCAEHCTDPDWCVARSLCKRASAPDRAALALRRFPLPSSSASATENYRRVLEWLYRDDTDRLICDLALEEAHR